ADDVRRAHLRPPHRGRRRSGHLSRARQAAHRRSRRAAHRRLMRAVLLALLAAVVSGCVDRLPEQDLRILGAVAVAKLPVEALAGDYQSDRAAADRQFWGKPIEVSGEVAETRQTPAGPVLVFKD